MVTNKLFVIVDKGLGTHLREVVPKPLLLDNPRCSLNLEIFL